MDFFDIGVVGDIETIFPCFDVVVGVFVVENIFAVVVKQSSIKKQR